MKQILPFFFLPMALFGQNFAAVDKLALNTPPSKTASIPTLARYLCAGQPDDEHKVRAVYAWVTLNIAYVDSTDERDVWATPEHLERQQPERVLRNKTAVCQGYANLFCALAAEAGLPCEIVTGIVKNAEGELENIGHAWVAAKIQGEWKLFDPTWGVPPVGLSRWKVLDKFFLVEPKQFILQHLPDDPVWQLLGNPVTERRFRESSDEEIQRYLDNNDEDSFHFQDTLNQWLALDSMNRLFASESRVLRFNGSNERVLFGLGQSYWGLFFDIRNTLDSLSDEAILNDTLQLDTVWFEAQVQLMERYHERARKLFDRLETRERLEKAAKFYSPKDVEAMTEKMRGDMRIGVFENMLYGIAEAVLSEMEIARLRYQLELAKKSYEKAERKADCDKLPSVCFEISHNRSLADVQLAQRQVRFVQDLANEFATAQHSKILSLHVAEARNRFLKAIEDCEAMRRRPPRFAFVEERISTARQGLFTLRGCEVRIARTALSPEAEAVLRAQKLPAKKAEGLVEKMARIAQTIETLKDSLKILKKDLGDEFAEIALFNLQLENFTLLFNLSNLQYRLALHEYEAAYTKNNLAAQRTQIRGLANKAIKTLREAGEALDFLEDSGKMPAGSVRQKELQVNKLSKNLKDFLDSW